MNEIKTVPKNGTPVLLKFHDDLSPYHSDNYWVRCWSGLYFVGKYNGDIMQWSFAAPVGYGGIDTEWLSEFI